ncbi:MAG TPA: zinc finger AN1 domain-containing stress-associated protein [Methanocella sp.]|jgi:hypothetical protein
MAGKKGYEGCEICGKELLLFKCKYCGKAFCEQHKAPEKHQCPGLEEFHRLQAMGVLAKPGGPPTYVEKKVEPAGPSRLEDVYKKGVFAVKLISVLAVIAASIIALALLISYINVNTPTWSYSIPVSNSTGATVLLTNYKNATDPTWNDLMTFLKADDTINIKYEYPSFTCADFARTLHDRAEAKGIKSGFVAIEFYNRTMDFSIYDNGDPDFSPPTRSFDTGHGLNVFKTTDKGLVYVDASSQKDFVSDKPQVRIAYVEEGQELNEIDLDWTTDTSYSFYESYKRTQLDFISDQRGYFKDRENYEARLIVNDNILTAELKDENDQLNSRAIELNARKSRIGPFYYPIGIVKKMDTYW